MRVLIAPDKFKGTLTAREAAAAIEAGWRRARPLDEISVSPMADGGEGTLAALVDERCERVERVNVTGPLGDPIVAPMGITDTPKGPLVVIESSLASGLQLIGEGRRDPIRSTSRGTGELIATGLETGAATIMVCLGGSATNDGGAGMAAALGVRFLDASGHDLLPGGGALLRLARVDMRGAHPGLARTSVIAAVDVDNPLCGPTGASVVYAPQKGAGPEQVALLDGALGHLAAIVERDLGVDLRHTPGAGAAGGLGFGLLAFCGARVRPGVDVVIEAVGLERMVDDADLVITGEGSFDAQSLRGKAPAGVVRLAGLAGTQSIVVCGVAEERPEGLTVVSLVEEVGAEAATGDARRSLEGVAEAVASAWRGR